MRRLSCISDGSPVFDNTAVVEVDSDLANKSNLNQDIGGSGSLQIIPDNSITPHQALNRDDAKGWRSAMQEYDALIRNGTCTLTSPD